MNLDIEEMIVVKYNSVPPPLCLVSGEMSGSSFYIFSRLFIFSVIVKIN